MLDYMTKGACVLAAALTFTGTSAIAETHTIEIVDGAYLPTITYVRNGDRLIFENESGADHTVNGPNDSWTTGVIPAGGTYIHNINPLDNETEISFSGVAADGTEINGEWSFEAAPLDAD
jgi:plastocyanin